MRINTNMVTIFVNKILVLFKSHYIQSSFDIEIELWKWRNEKCSLYGSERLNTRRINGNVHIKQHLLTKTSSSGMPILETVFKTPLHLVACR